MERVRITKACDALDRPYPDGPRLCRFEPGTVLRLLREDDREFYKVVYLGMPLFVPKACAVGATKDEPLIEILGVTEGSESAEATTPGSAGASRHTADSDAPPDAAISEAPDSVPPSAPEARVEGAPLPTARPASKPAAFVVPRWLRWLASQRVAAQEQHIADSEKPLEPASPAGPVPSIPVPTSAPARAPRVRRRADAGAASSDLPALVRRPDKASEAVMEQLTMISTRAGDALPPLPKSVDEMNDAERKIYEVVAAAVESLEFIHKRALVAMRLLAPKDEVGQK